MPHSIEFTDLLAATPAQGGELRVAEGLRTAFLESDPAEVATTTDDAGDRLTITSSGTPMTVAQVQAELQVLIIGE